MIIYKIEIEIVDNFLLQYGSRYIAICIPKGHAGKMEFYKQPCHIIKITALWWLSGIYHTGRYYVNCSGHVHGLWQNSVVVDISGIYESIVGIKNNCNVNIGCVLHAWGVPFVPKCSLATNANA